MSYRSILTGLAVVAAGALFADDVPFVWDSWFNEDYSGINVSTWADTAGTWTRSASDGSSIEEQNGERYLQVGAAPGDLRFSAPSSSGSYKPVCVDSHMTFVASRNGEEYASAPTDSYAGLILRMTETENATNLTFVGWTARNWTELSSPDVTPAEDTYFDVRIELDLSVRPNKVRYSVDGHVLAAADGSTWLDANTSGRGNKAYSANDNVKDHVHHVVFCGTGRVGAFSGKQASTIAPRATVAFDSSVSNRVAAGSTLSFGVTPNDGATVGTLRYVWRRVDSTADYTVTAADYGHWLIVEAYDENGYVGAASNYVSRLPVLHIQTDDGLMPTAQKEEHDATMRTVLGERQYSSKEIYSGPLTIKVRGNSTKNLPKKPYKLKLDSKTNMFGLDPNGGKNKHWVLLANYYDECMLRNKVAYDMSHELGVPVWQKSTWVDVILNGQFLGCYQFCQHIRVGEDRVNIYDWEDAAETVGKAALKNAEIAAQLAAIGVTDKGQFSENFSWVNTGVFTLTNGQGSVDISSVKGVKKNDISGGYLFELSNEYDELSQFQIRPGIKDSVYKVMLNKPEYLFTSELMMDVCRNYWTDLFDAWTSGRGTSAAGSNWLDLCDLDSMTGYWLTMYIMGNSDSSYKSRYAYMDRGGKMFMGPAWDFDWGCGSPQVRKWGTNDVGQVYLKDPSPTGWHERCRAGVPQGPLADRLGPRRQRRELHGRVVQRTVLLHEAAREVPRLPPLPDRPSPGQRHLRPARRLHPRVGHRERDALVLPYRLQRRDRRRRRVQAVPEGPRGVARRQVRHARLDRLEHRHAPAQLSPPSRDVDPHAVIPGPFGRSRARPADHGQRRRLRRTRRHARRVRQRTLPCERPRRERRLHAGDPRRHLDGRPWREQPRLLPRTHLHRHLPHEQGV